MRDDGVLSESAMERVLPVRDVRGQASLEYALIIFAFMSMLLAVAALWHAGRDGKLLQMATSASSHQMGGGDALGGAQDIALY